MACTITQADLGPQFEDVAAGIAALFIDTATVIVLGPLACQADKYAAWLGCCVDPCMAIKLLAQHLIASDPDSGAGSADVTSERVGDVAVAYSSATSSSGAFGGTIYGRTFAMLLGKYEQCRAGRQHTGTAFSGKCGC
jgi:hypothetical protein